VRRIEEKEEGRGRKVDGARLKQGREYFDQRNDKDTDMWKKVKLERELNKKEKRGERDKIRKNKKKLK